MPKQKFEFTKEFLVEQYIRLNKSCKHIADELGYKSSATIQNALVAYGIQPRKTNTGRFSADRVGEITRSCWYRIKKLAEARNIQFHITREYAWQLFCNQKGSCALSGLPINFAKNESDNLRTSQTASLDRIDNSIGYIKGNIQWLHKDINLMKLDHTQQEFLRLCKAVVSYNT